MTLRHHVTGWALLTLIIGLASCESIPPVSNRYRIYQERPNKAGGLYKHLPYNLASNEVRMKIRGIDGWETVNRAFAIFDLRAFLSLVQNEGTGRVEGTQANSSLVATLKHGEVVAGVSSSRLETTQSGSEILGQESATDILTAEGDAQIDEGKQESRVETTTEHAESLSVASTVRFATVSAFEDYLQRRAAFLRVRNAAIADLVEQDQVLRMIFQFSSKRFSELIRTSTISRGDLLDFKKTISVTDEIVPGETFEYTLEAHNSALATIENITLYDEFPVFLHFERNFRVTLTRADGTEESFDERSHPAFFQSAVTDDEWERGKICWVLATDFRHGDTLKLSFDATAYRSRGTPTQDGVSLYIGPTASPDEVVTKLQADDRIFVVEPSDQNEDFLRVFVRRPVTTAEGDSNGVGTLARFEGFLLAEDFRQQVEEDATDQERRLQEGGATSDED